ncbi:hypothetical protein BD410DRAFT_830784 [Rickenella mellea]|uniref:Uncharacterized protein n=1 Tax=Rickenella mellea TaxID=50990 RepID=A0A4Y7PVQ6_9AGAM|nr:hypothetical protein BD410DRAFT_830784 [Rickenella mellea]
MRKAGLGNGFGYFILRDGTMYFLVKLVIGVLSAIPLIAPIPAQLGNVATVVPVIGNPLTLVLASRLVLNLRQVSSKQETGGRSLRTVDTIRDPVFAANSFLGNIGAQLRIGPDDEDDFEEEACRDSDIELDFVKNDVVAGENTHKLSKNVRWPNAENAAPFRMPSSNIRRVVTRFRFLEARWLRASAIV